MPPAARPALRTLLPLALFACACSGGGGEKEPYEYVPDTAVPESVQTDAQAAFAELLSGIRLEATHYANWYTQFTFTSDTTEVGFTWHDKDYCIVDLVQSTEAGDQTERCRPNILAPDPACPRLTSACIVSPDRKRCTCSTRAPIDHLYVYPTQEWFYAGGDQAVAYASTSFDIPVVAKSLSVEFVDYIPGESFVCNPDVMVKWIGGQGLSMLLAKQYPGRLLGLAGDEPADWTVPFDWSAATCIDVEVANNGDGVFQYALKAADFAGCPDLSQGVVSVRPVVARDFPLDDGPFAKGSRARKGAAAAVVIPFSCL